MRLALARCLYSYSPVLLLDDPLSALDATTAHHVFEQGLTGSLVADRLVIMSTHQIAMCKARATMLLQLDNGQVTKQGIDTYIAPAESPAQKHVAEEEVAAAEDNQQVDHKFMSEEVRAVGKVKFLV